MDETTSRDNGDYATYRSRINVNDPEKRIGFIASDEYRADQHARNNRAHRNLPAAQ